MADHFSGPRALSDPAADITDVYAFPSPERPGHLVLVMDVFPAAAPTALFSDAVTYRFRLRPVTATTAGGTPAFSVGEDEYAFDVTFDVPVRGDGGGTVVQLGTCAPPGGAEIPFRVGDEQPTVAPGLRDLRRCAARPVLHRPESRAGHRGAGAVGVPGPRHQLLDGANVLSIVVELDVATVLGPDTGPLLAVVGETVTSRRTPGPAGAHGPSGDQERHHAAEEVRSRQPRPRDPRPLQRRGRLQPEPGLRRGLPRPVERQPGLLRPAGRQDRLAAGRSGRPPPDRAAAGGLPRRRHVETVLRRRHSDLEIERAVLAGRPHTTCGGRSPNHDIIDTLYTLLVGGLDGAADQRRRRPADPADGPQLPLPGSPQPESAGPDGHPRRPRRRHRRRQHHHRPDRGRPRPAHHQRRHRPGEPAGPDRRPGGSAHRRPGRAATRRR